MNLQVSKEPRIVGMLRDTHNCEVYHRRKIDFFFIEIPNTPGFEIYRSRGWAFGFWGVSV